MVADVVLELGGVLASLVLGISGLRMKDLIQRGLVRRRMARLAASSGQTALPPGRVACPECAEAILPAARRCPYCRSVITPPQV